MMSANNWEAADLGDAERNSKFMKLMGGSKKNTCTPAENPRVQEKAPGNNAYL